MGACQWDSLPTNSPKPWKKANFQIHCENWQACLMRQGGTNLILLSFQEVLLAKLFPFVKECLESQPNTVVLEDGAPAHTHFYQQELYNIHKINHLLWPGNSPDLNMIEPAWMWLK
ncbi:conserved hypothetical protein [Coccidioides posadasii str. Silveira]|uniref:Tc1-like transposase DDE domain-containing protein n=1 Tax=Coccidioides posadasii (strain RMSCC 757 / Silveira) TaxID=443226 RepID=E9CWU9_COCPS|nr:conserved hypothetical protein [Coccidioides posadasii str. Silveira]